MESISETSTSDRGGKPPCYLIGDQAKQMVMTFVGACKALNQGNVSFQLAQPVRAVFQAKESDAGWELTVSTGYGNCKRDIYQIIDEKLVFKYSETD